MPRLFRVWIERAEFSLKLHKILNLGTLPLKTSAVKVTKDLESEESFY